MVTRLRAMPPADEADRPATANLLQKVARTNGATVHAGLDEGQPFDTRAFLRPARGLAAASPIKPEFRVLTVLVEFPDKPHKARADFYDALIYGGTVDGVGIKSVRDWYADNSGGQLELSTPVLPSTIGWVMAPQPYSYYANNQGGFGSFPRNAQGLARDVVVKLAQAGFNFRPFDNNGDGVVDGLCIVHTGPGRELTGSNADIHSHQWGIPKTEVSPGLFVSGYTMEPEYWKAVTNGIPDMKPGVFCHEFGHMLGLPDWYSVMNDGSGGGKWSPMAYGSWNGYLGSHPPYLDPWGMMRLGFAAPRRVTQSGSYTLTGPRDFLWIPVAAGDDRLGYTVVMRPLKGWDQFLPTGGVLIQCIDGRLNGNRRAWYPGRPYNEHYECAVIECDGNWSLGLGVSKGQQSDLWPLKTDVWKRDWLDTGFYGDVPLFRILNITENADQTQATVDIQFNRLALPGDFNDDGQLTAEDAYGLIQHVFYGGPGGANMDLDGNLFPDAMDIQVLLDRLSDSERQRLFDLIQTGG